ECLRVERLVLLLDFSSECAFLFRQFLPLLQYGQLFGAVCIALKFSNAASYLAGVDPLEVTKSRVFGAVLFFQLRLFSAHSRQLSLNCLKCSLFFTEVPGHDKWF